MAQIILTIPDAQVPRLQDAFAFITGKAVIDVTVQDAKDYLINDLKQLVWNTERRIAEATVTDPVDFIDVT